MARSSFTRWLAPLGLSLAASVSAAAEPETASPAAPGEPNLEAGKARYTAVCAQCHGAKGEGNFELKSPSIAGLPNWYIGIQVGKFQRNWRGAKPEDVPGHLMHAIAQALDPEGVRDVAGYITSLELIPTVTTIKGGDAERGAELFRERCMECHRYNGRGEPVFRSAQLIGLQDWYLLSQMKKFQAGNRGGHVDDVDGNKMHRITEKMTDESFRDIATHIADLAKRYAKEKPRQR
jgi:cytochrome c553